MSLVPDASKSVDGHRVGGESVRSVDEGVEDLVEARGGPAEAVVDGRVLGAGVLPELALEGEDGGLHVGQVRPAGVFAAGRGAAVVFFVTHARHGAAVAGRHIGAGVLLGGSLTA